MRQTQIALLALLCLPLMACFEEPVREHLHLSLRGDGPVVVTVVQEVTPSNDIGDNAELTDRLDESRDTIDHSLDPWSQRFALLEPLAEHVSIERVDGELRRSIHSGVLSSFDEVLRMVEADGLTGNLAVVNGTARLELFPTGGSRATYTQRQDADRLLSEWSVALAVYFEAVADLYAYLDEQPDRGVPCFAHIFDKHEGLENTGPLEPVEEKLVVRVKDVMEEVAFALMVDDGEAFSLNELTRLVYDPFPARLTIAVEGQVLEAEGFSAGADFFERPPVDAWNALLSLEGRWISPDLVTAAAAPGSDDVQPDPDVLAVASIPRRYFPPPDAAEVESAIVAGLVPEEMLRLVWRPATVDAAADEESVDWLAVMAKAETSVPD
jgi:hypothetical protein